MNVNLSAPHANAQYVGRDGRIYHSDENGIILSVGNSHAVLGLVRAGCKIVVVNFEKASFTVAQPWIDPSKEQA